MKNGFNNLLRVTLSDKKSINECLMKYEEVLKLTPSTLVLEVSSSEDLSQKDEKSINKLDNIESIDQPIKKESNSETNAPNNLADDIYDLFWNIKDELDQKNYDHVNALISIGLNMTSGRLGSGDRD